MLKNILDNFKDNKTVDNFLLDKEVINAFSILEEAIILAVSFLKKPQKVLVVKNNLYYAQKLFEYLNYFLEEKNINSFFFDEALRIETISSSQDFLLARLDTLNQALSGEPKIIVTHTLGFIRNIPSKTNYLNFKKKLTINQYIKKEDLVNFLLSAGYKRVNMVEHPLQFSLRGAIIDVFSINYENPCRIEFFDDNIDSIRVFDIKTQRTINLIDQVEILPATEYVITNKENTNKINTYLEEAKKFLAHSIYEELVFNVNKDIEQLLYGSNNPYLIKYYSLLEDVMTISEFFEPDICVLSNKEDIIYNANLIQKEETEYFKELFLIGRSLTNLKSFQDIEKNISRNDKVIYFKNVLANVNDTTLGIKEINPFLNKQILIEQFKIYIKDKYKINIYLDNENQINTFKHLLDEYEINHKHFNIFKIQLIESFEITNKKQVFINSENIFGTKRYLNKFFKKYNTSKAIDNYDELDIGDYLVHENYGIGIYRGIKTIKNYNSEKDYLHIEYRNSEALYVPPEQFIMVRKYVGSEGKVPSLNKLGSSEWTNTKNKIKGRLKELAIDLLQLYEIRNQKIGFAFSPDDELQKQFEDAFVYIPTKDQKNAIKQIKLQMEKETPADILLCGDVGFGKTEVAFVAAFKAIKDNKQVAFLCPTTLLSSQHFNNAGERFQNFGVKVALLNRFVSAKQTTHILEKLKKGEIDLLIGTHRLLSNDVKFKDLGLLIVDEEQRFGVEHKEKIKDYKNDIDVLSLSATPIPRTLQMSLIGIRTLLQLDTAPDNRMAVQTYVIEKDNKIIKEIIERELSRRGQVFYLYNRVNTINKIANDIKKQIPSAKVGVIHGQMDKELIEEVSYAYYNGEIDVLVCTTIIENGIDVNNANTIIIEDADRLGLAQLYQIKGRVGRGDRLAYAYLLVNKGKQISESAQKRLTSIKQFSELGSGYKIAIKDLSIRGAGDLIGPRQAGFIDNIGMDLYVDLLREAIQEEKGFTNEVETKNINLIQTKGYIPLSYAEIDLNKINIYQRLEKIKSLLKLSKYIEELKDIFGKIPKDVQLLLDKRKTEIILKSELVESVKEYIKYFDIYLSKKHSQIDGIGVDLFNIINDIDFKNLHLSFQEHNIKIRINKYKTDWLKYVRIIISKLEEKFKN